MKSMARVRAAIGLSMSLAAGCTVEQTALTDEDTESIRALTRAYASDCTGMSLPASQVTDVPSSCGVVSKSSPDNSYVSTACGAYVVEWNKSSGTYVRARVSPIDSEYPTTEAECKKWAVAYLFGYERIVPPGGGTPYWAHSNPNPPYEGFVIMQPYWTGNLCQFLPFPGGYLPYWQANAGNPYQSRFRTAVQAFYRPNGPTSWQARRVKTSVTRSNCF